MKTTTAKPAAAPKKDRGNLKPTEIKPLVMAARAAYDFQADLGNTNGQDFNAWRHEQCMAAVGKPGITACSHDHYRPLMAHFQILAGRDEKAFQNLTTTGQASKLPGDTHEARRQLAHLILEKLSDHITLADKPWPEYLAEWQATEAAAWAFHFPEEPFPGVDPVEARRAYLRREEIANSGGPIREGYLVYLIRQKTRRPDLQLGKDLPAALAERCTVTQLTQIRDTLVNRIAAKEDTGDRHERNKSQSSSRAKAARSPKKLDLPRW